MMLQPGVISKAISTRIRLGGVSFLNAKPLLFGLEHFSNEIDLALDVPSRLLAGMAHRRFDVALLPVIDYQRFPGLRLLMAGGIGCDGPTLTVRIFSPIPIEQIRTLACDADSHTSVALARIILADRYGVRPEFIARDFHGSADRVSSKPDARCARLLIGDKVVRDEPRDLPHQIDLGEAWKELTGLPFVFAAWMARAEVELGALPLLLESAKIDGLRNVDRIIAAEAKPRGWPAEIARKYLTEYLKFDIGAAQLEAIAAFHQLAHKHGILENPARALDVVNSCQ